MQVFYRICGNSNCAILARMTLRLTARKMALSMCSLAKNSKDRFVPLDAETIAWLQKWEAIRPESDWYFCTLKGGQLSTNYIRDVFKRKSKKVGGVHPGRTQEKAPAPAYYAAIPCATEMLEDGLHIREVQET